MSRRSSASILALTLVLSTVSLFAAPRTVRLGLNAKNAEESQKSYGQLLKHLATDPSLKFEVSTYPTYDALYAAFKDKKVDLALVGSVKYVEAHHELGAIPIASEGGLVRSVLIVAKGSSIRAASELKGKRFLFGYKDSTSTHLFPLLLLSKNHIKESEVNGTFVGPDQQKIVDALVAGQGDAAGVVESVYRRNKDKLRVLEVSAPFPGGPIMAQKGTDPKLVALIQKLVVSFKDPAGPRFIDGATAIKDVDFNQVRFLCKVLYGKSYI